MPGSTRKPRRPGSIAELGEPVTFQVAAERQFLQRLTGAGVPAGTAELLITREWAILAGENDYTTGTFQQITGRPPRLVAEFLQNHRAEFALTPTRHPHPIPPGGFLASTGLDPRTLPATPRLRDV